MELFCLTRYHDIKEPNEGYKTTMHLIFFSLIASFQQIQEIYIFFIPFLFQIIILEYNPMEIIIYKYSINKIA